MIQSMQIRDASADDWVAIWGRALGEAMLASAQDEAFAHPTHGYVGRRVMHRFL
jgi:hypothetical protein